MISGACHCGAVVVETAALPATLTECNCSICSRYGARWAHLTRREVRVKCAPGAAIAYTWGDRSIEFYHCVTCGCVTHYESIDKNDDSRVSINARILPRQSVEKLRSRHFDGADTWEFLDE
jgi:hypothetical protein